MKKTIFAVAAALASLFAHAADNAATATLTKALSCDIAPGKVQSVIKAAKALGAKPAKDKAIAANDYTLPSPIVVFGLSITNIAITPSDEGPETYAAIFLGAKSKLNDIATAAQLKPLAGGFVRDTPNGSLSAGVFDHDNVWLTCTPLKK